MTESHLSPVHSMRSGLCDDTAGEATALIGRRVRGDRRALEEIFVIWGPVFLGISQRMLGEYPDTIKVVRNTFLRMWRRATDYDPHKVPPFVWAFTILRDLCIEHLGRHPHEQIQPSTNPALPEVANEDPRVMPLDDWHRLKSALDSLSTEELECLETAVFLGYAHSASKSPPNPPSLAVKACLRRALNLLRNQLSRYEL